MIIRKCEECPLWQENCFCNHPENNGNVQFFCDVDGDDGESIHPKCPMRRLGVFEVDIDITGEAPIQQVAQDEALMVAPCAN